MTTPEQNYIQDVLQSIIESALEAKQISETGKSQKSNEQRAFDDGRALGYYEAVSTLINQARVFNISTTSIPSVTFDPDKELLRKQING